MDEGKLFRHEEGLYELLVVMGCVEGVGE